MKPDEKYMSQISVDNTNIKFTPPSFPNNLFRNDIPNTMIKNNISTNTSSELFPSETEQSQLYCYYNSLSDCAKKNATIAQDLGLPTPSEILRNFDLDLDETTDLERNSSKNDVDKIYSQIEKKNPGIFATFSAYRIPYPITKVIIKRLIKLTLMYYDKE